jgi:phytoene dehydrogenase-like protein
MLFEVIVCLLTALVSFYFWAKKPFNVRSAEVTSSSRNLCHVRYASDKVADEYDVIIVGSGMSGLTSAAILSRMGKSVLVLEKHPTAAGGATHTFEEGKDKFDSGLHYTVRWSPLLLQLAVGKERAVPFDRLGVDDGDGTFERVVLGDEEPFEIKHGETHLDALRAKLGEHDSEADVRGLEEYLRVSTRLNDQVAAYMFSKLLPAWLQRWFWRLFLRDFAAWAKLTTEQALKKLVPNNARLRAHLCSLWIDTGSRPDQCTFWLSSAVQRGLPQEGACYPIGGPDAMNRSLVTTIEGNGGRVVVRAAVSELLMSDDGSRVAGVRVARANNGRDVKDVRARLGVISSAGYMNTFGEGGIVPAAVAERYNVVRTLDSIPPGDSFFMANIGMVGTAAELGIDNANMWILPVDADTDDHFDAVRTFWADPMHAPMPAMVTFPSVKDKKTRNNERVTCQMLVPANWSHVERFAKLENRDKDAEYQQFKQHMAKRCVDLLLKHYPRIPRERVDNVNLSTPLSVHEWLNSPAGTAIGLAPTPERFVAETNIGIFDTRTKVPGLWITGQDTLLMGVPLAQVAGTVTALRFSGFLDSVKYIAQQILS